jgi:hypothetical protein
MSIFRWIIGVVWALLASGAVVSFAVNILADIPEWLVRARVLGRLAWAVTLFWFNIEVWGRVVYTLVHWNG